MRAVALVLIVGCGRWDFARIVPVDGAGDGEQVVVDGSVATWSLVQATGAALSSTTIAPSKAGHLIVASTP